MSPGITKTVYPISMLLENRPCLIVGGGKVAARKADGLLEAGAEITVISPDLDHHLAQLMQAGKLRHIRRTYEAGDAKGFALVFAATGNRYTNRAVLTECQSLHVPCCPVDGNWMDGDFVTPATIRKGLLSVAISTGGQNCRRSRLIKENLSRHLDMVDSADLLVIGTSHKELNLKERERLHLQGETCLQTGSMLMHVWGLHEFLLLDTCNRTELLAVTATGTGTDAILQRILGFDTLAPDTFYVKTGVAAFEHVALLASGLLSQMVGENHIVSQIKDALSGATSREWAGGMIKEWIDAALHISKEIRGKMPADLLQGEIEDAAIQYMMAHQDQPGLSCHVPRSSSPVITVIGTGTVGTGIVTRFAGLGIPCHWVYHRNPPEAIPAGTTLQPWDQLEDALAKSDCVLCATASTQPILTAQMHVHLAGRPVLLIDLATPRNIDASIADQAPQIERVDLDSLKIWQARQTGIWDSLWTQSQQIIRQHETFYDQIMRSFQSAPNAEA